MVDVAYDPIRNRDAGREWINNLFQQRAQRQAGQQLAQGNYGAGANILAQNGDLEGFSQLNNYGQAQADRTREQEQRATAEQLQFTLSTARALRGVAQQGGDVLAEYDRLQPVLQQMGTTPEMFQQLRGQLATDPNGFLSGVEQVAGQQLRQLEIVNLGGGTAVAIDGATGQEVNRFEAARQPINVGGVLVDPVTLQPVLDAREPQYQTVTNSDGTTSVVAIDQPAPIRPGSMGGGGGDGSFESIIPGLLQREGGFVASDGSSGAPANFGINQRANPDVDVRNLSQAQAQELYRERYWNPVVQAGVPPQAREAVFDFAVNAGPRRALQLWEQSGGDIGRFNELRLNFYRGLDDYERYGPAWERRVRETSGGGSTVSPAGGTRVVASGEDRGQRPLTPAQAAAESARTFTQERQLRAEFGNSPATRTLAQVRPQVQIIGQIAERARRGEEISAQDDLALIFSYMKMLDPGSVVREGEFANAQNTAGIPERVLNAYNNARSGTRLSDAQRNQFFQSATGVMNAYQRDYNASVERARGLAESYGLNADRVATPPAPTAAAPRQRNVRFQQTPQQEATRRRIVPDGAASGARPGTSQNPYIINPTSQATMATSYANIPSGSLYIDPQGRIRRKP